MQMQSNSNLSHEDQEGAAKGGKDLEFEIPTN